MMLSTWTLIAVYLGWLVDKIFQTTVNKNIPEGRIDIKHFIDEEFRYHSAECDVTLVRYTSTM